LTIKVANQKAEYLAGAFKNLARGKHIEKFRYSNKGALAFLGSKKAIADTPKGFPKPSRQSRLSILEVSLLFHVWSETKFRS